MTDPFDPKEEDSGVILRECLGLSKQAVVEHENAKLAIAKEREAKAFLLLQLVQVVKPALAAISSGVKGMGTPYSTGVLVARNKDEVLYLSADGDHAFFWLRDETGAHSRTAERIVEDRWSVYAIAEALADELDANVEGKLKLIARAGAIAAKVRAVAVLLEGVR